MTWRNASRSPSGCTAFSTLERSSRTASASNEVGASMATIESSWKMWFGTMSRNAPALS